jgi:hypothetical protein
MLHLLKRLFKKGPSPAALNIDLVVDMEQQLVYCVDLDTGERVRAYFYQ